MADEIEHVSGALDKMRELQANEEMVLEALRETYNQGKMDYLHFSPAYDVTAARAAALSFAIAIARLEAGPESD